MCWEFPLKAGGDGNRESITKALNKLRKRTVTFCDRDFRQTGEVL